jgi:FHA domain
VPGLHLSSAGHVLAAPDAAGVLRAQPAVAAIAVLEPPHLLTGNAAARRARLAPLYVSRDHWEAPDDQPLPRPLPGAATRAELAYQQLLELWPDAAEPGVLAVSPACTQEEVARFAGLAAAAGRSLAALVDAAVATVADRPGAARALWLEAEAGRLVLAELLREQDDAGAWQVRRARVDVSRAVGWDAVEDAVARAVASHFVRATRFDPLAVAGTEQALYDALPHAFAELASRGTASITLDHGGTPRAATLAGDEVAAACQRLVAETLRLVQSARRAGERLTLHVGARIAQLPGLVEALRGMADLELDLLPHGAAALGAARLLATPAAAVGEVAWRRALPSVAPVVLAASSVPAHDLPTHVVWAGRAWPLAAAPLVIGREPGAGGLGVDGPSSGLSRVHCQLVRSAGEAVVEDLSTYGTWLNGERVRRRARLRAGDRLRLGLPGVELLLVVVEAPAAAPANQV